MANYSYVGSMFVVVSWNGNFLVIVYILPTQTLVANEPSGPPGVDVVSHLLSYIILNRKAIHGGGMWILIKLLMNRMLATRYFGHYMQ